MADKLGMLIKIWSPDVIVPVPMYAKNSVQEGTIRQKLLRVNLEKLYMSRLTHSFLKEIKIQFR